MQITDGKKYISEVKDLILEYTNSLGRDLSFQCLDEELSNPAMKYTPPQGEILVAIDGNEVVGMVAYHRHSEKRCEMKRLYVKPETRKHHIGKALVREIIIHAIRAGYTEMVLDTIKPLTEAINLYQKFGFKECDAYYNNPMEDVIYMRKQLPDLKKIYTEEDTFPTNITKCEEHEYGLIFYNEENKDSYDSNHAVIFRDKVTDLINALEEIVLFYTQKGIKPSIYQSISDDDYFKQIENELSICGFRCFWEEQKYMVLLEENTITPNSDIFVDKITEWKDIYGTEIFEKAGEPWEIDVVKKAITNNNTVFLVAFYKGNPVGMTYFHIKDGICRVNYLLVSKECRNIGVGRALINRFTEYCKANHIENCYLWPDGETAEKIYCEAGFRVVEIKVAGRASYVL